MAVYNDHGREGLLRRKDSGPWDGARNSLDAILQSNTDRLIRCSRKLDHARLWAHVVCRRRGGSKSSTTLAIRH
jgi:hypothetical protein